MRSLPLATLATLSLAVTGCTMERGYAPGERAREATSNFDNDDFLVEDEGDDFIVEEDVDDGWYDEGGVLPISAGRVRGDIGAVTQFDSETDYVDAWGDSQWTSITLSATDDLGRLGMIILELSNIDLQTVPAGTYSYASQSIEGGEVYVTGCSEDAESYYDAPANDGSVIVTDEPDGSREVTVRATLPGYSSGTTNAEARFTID